MILQIGILLLFLAAGEAVVALTGIKVPSSIIGMLLLTLALQTRLLKVSHVEGVASFFTRNLGFFFIPAGVGLMNCLNLLSDQWLPIAVATAGSTMAIIATTGWVYQLVRRFLARQPKSQTSSQSAAS